MLNIVRKLARLARELNRPLDAIVLPERPQFPVSRNLILQQTLARMNAKLSGTYMNGRWQREVVGVLPPTDSVISAHDILRGPFTLPGPARCGLCDKPLGTTIGVVDDIDVCGDVLTPLA